ncbi:MAG: hypothetical protein KF886_24620 [Candidatus Hydrogenedentes bacterium]|nr:hypothetical protein [Candidatus Hydrogenedentota bacterium]
MKYEISFTKRGGITDKQLEDLLSKLKIKIVKEKAQGSSVTWTVTGPNGLKTDDLTAALRKFHLSKEMSHAQVSAI